ncbi:hypothetical protein [Actinocorallia longicatena]|uniref:Uncharacterized protein n=1 Tax=Actinocorallia longicatena TaxID=111803 RepID=A0ABP6QH29_9ACTN
MDKIREGYYAVWRGEEFPASPSHDEVRLYTEVPLAGFKAALPGRFVKTVPYDELDRLHYVVTRCLWNDQPFVILGEHDGWLRVEYTGGRAPVAERLKLERFDRGVYQAWAPVTEIREIREEVYE